LAGFEVILYGRFWVIPKGYAMWAAVAANQALAPRQGVVA